MPEQDVYEDAFGRRGYNPEDCDCCGGSGIEYEETCVVCGGYGFIIDFEVED